MYPVFAKRTLQFGFQFPPVGNNFVLAIFVNLTVAVKFLIFLCLLNLCLLRALVPFYFLVISFSIVCNFRYQPYCQSQVNFARAFFAFRTSVPRFEAFSAYIHLMAANKLFFRLHVN